jgi:glycosyltransferase involved in cell wall biosynthesis
MLQAVLYFQHQNYPERELIILDDGLTDARNNVPCDPQIRYVRLDQRLSVGAKRNLGCELARGKIIAQWDDDDWYAPTRLTAQVAPLLAESADVTGLTRIRFFDVDRWEFWSCTPELHRRLFAFDVACGTLVYRRSLFDQLARYPNNSLAEDAAFLKAAIDRGARFQTMVSDELFLYVRHGANTWNFSCGHHLDEGGWRRIEEPQSLAPDRAFYAGYSPTAGGRCGAPGVARTGEVGALTAAPSAPKYVPAVVNVTTSRPLVSCIMPTRNRRPFVPKAIEYFLRQDYPHSELVILDDGDDRIADLIPDVPAVRYIALSQRLRLGPKRNAAIDASRGQIILHWDDDDWMDSARISRQVLALLAAEADICGTSKICFCDIESGLLSVYRYPQTERRWLYGATLCYRRSLWQQKPFEPLDIGEDTRFVWAPPQGRILDLGDLPGFIAIVHRENTSSPRPLSGPNWLPWNGDRVDRIIGDDWAFYEGMRHRDRNNG